MNKTAFTLAEVLITLAIIGVVAAITMPVLMTNINERVNSERQANIVYKINQAMEHMRATGKLTAYDSTESFVNELEKHLKITKRCDNEHIAECWPTDKVVNAAGEEFNVSDAKTARNLSLNRDNNNVGLILADGASIILNFDTSFEGMDIGAKVQASPIGLPNGNGKSKVYLQYTTNLMAPLAFVMDINGKKGPNRETFEGKYYDIRSFGGASFTEYDADRAACAYDYYKASGQNKGTCVYFAGTVYSAVDCSNSSAEGYEYCGPHISGESNDHWAGAKYKCASMNMTLPTVSQLQTIQANKSNYPSIASITTAWFWSSEEDSGSPYLFGRRVSFHDNGNANIHRKYLQHQVICVGN